MTLRQMRFLLEQAQAVAIDLEGVVKDIKEAFKDGQRWWNVNVATGPKHDVQNADGSDALPFLITQEELIAFWHEKFGFSIGPADQAYTSLVNDLGLSGIKVVTGRPHAHEPVLWLTDLYIRPWK